MMAAWAPDEAVLLLKVCGLQARPQLATLAAATSDRHYRVAFHCLKATGLFLAMLLYLLQGWTSPRVQHTHDSCTSMTACSSASAHLRVRNLAQLPGA